MSTYYVYKSFNPIVDETITRIYARIRNGKYTSGCIVDCLLPPCMV